MTSGHRRFGAEDPLPGSLFVFFKKKAGSDLEDSDLTRVSYLINKLNGQVG